MITVRFPSGFSVQYNDLMYSCSGNGESRLYKTAAARDKGSGASVVVMGDCVIEHERPCRTYNAAGTPEDIALEMLAMHTELRLLRLQLKKIKGKS